MELKKQEVELVLNNEELDIIIKALQFFKTEEGEVELLPEDAYARVTILKGLSPVSTKAQEALKYLNEQYEKEVEKALGESFGDE